ncbi:MAG: hypothetical protein ACSHWZ_04400 [Sulfitobacter sp.]
MRMVQNISLVLAFSLLMGAPAAAQDTAVFAPLNLTDFGQRDLLEERRSLMLSLVAAPPETGEGAARAQIYLDLAELHLSQMLRLEAADYLTALDPETLTAPQQRRHRSLQLALDLLAEQEGLPQAVSRSMGWPEGQALRTAAFARLGAQDEAARLLPLTAEGLSALSPAIKAAILPDLLEAALTAENWEVAEALAARFSDHPELREAAPYWFLLARASEMTGDLLMAFDGYARAAGGSGAYAHRARLALIALGRRTDTLPLSDAVALLKTARWVWSGDEVAAQGAALLADYAGQQGDYQAQLWALATLLAQTEDEAEANALRLRARETLATFYAAGAAGEMGLGAFLEGHGVIMAGWRFDGGFVERAIDLPKTLLRTGMTGLAAREFRTLRAFAETAAELGQTPVDPALIAELRREEARALLAGGQADAAIDLLSSAAEGQGTDSEAEALLIDALSQAGRSGELAALHLRARDMDLERGRAVALYEAGNWAPAHQALLGLWASYPAQFSFSDAARLTLAAYEMGDTATIARAGAAFPALSALPGWREIAARLELPAATAELSSDAMRQSMQDANRILDAVSEVTDTMHSQ